MAYQYQYPNDPEATTSYYQPRGIGPVRTSTPMPPSSIPEGVGESVGNSDTRARTGAVQNGSSGTDWAGAATGALGLAANTYGMTQQRFNFGNIAQSQTDPNSAPAYTAGQVSNQVFNATPRGASGGELLSGAAQGAKIGASLGGPLGAGIGAAGGALVTGIGGAIRKNQQDTEKKRKQGQVVTAQNTYNQQAESYRNQQNQLYNYFNQNNAEGREYNVLRSRMTA